MPVLMVLELPGTTTDQYDQINEALGIQSDEDVPDGLIEHVAGSDGDTITIVDVWESEEALGDFLENRLQPAAEKVGLPGDSPPRILPVHNRLEGAGAEPNYLVLIAVDDLGTDGYDQMASNMEAHQGDGSDGPWASHTAAKGEGGGVFVVDVWDSPESFGRFAEEQIGPAGAAVGLGPVDPRMIPVHNRFRGRGAT
jgi:hypothetical protein